MSNMWDYRDSTWTEGHDLVGYDVEATDGSIGKIDQATDDTSTAYLVVDTGPWIFGKKRLIPAGTVTSVDHDGQHVYVAMTKDQIKGAPTTTRTTWTTTPISSTATTTAPPASDRNQTANPLKTAARTLGVRAAHFCAVWQRPRR